MPARRLRESLKPCLLGKAGTILRLSPPKDTVISTHVTLTADISIAVSSREFNVVVLGAGEFYLVLARTLTLTSSYLCHSC